VFDRWWSIQQERLGFSEGTRKMIEIIRQVPVFGTKRVREVVEQALHLGSRDTATVLHLLRQKEGGPPMPLSPEELGSLSKYEYAPPDLGGYDHLLGQEVH
jgi:hypothetical protein